MARAPRLITAVLSEHRSGETVDDLSQQLQDMVAAVAEHQKAASLTIKFLVKPRGRHNGVDLHIEAKSTLPKAEISPSVFFVDADNNLVREDPRLATMAFRSVPIDPAKEFG